MLNARGSFLILASVGTQTKETFFLVLTITERHIRKSVECLPPLLQPNHLPNQILNVIMAYVCMRCHRLFTIFYAKSPLILEHLLGNLADGDANVERYQNVQSRKEHLFKDGGVHKRALYRCLTLLDQLAKPTFRSRYAHTPVGTE